MVISCCAINCTNRQNCGDVKTQFHRFPLKNDILCKQWVLAMRRADWIPSKFSFICGEHFTDDDYKTKCRRYLKPSAVPSVFNFQKIRKRNKEKSETDSRYPVVETTENLDIDYTSTNSSNLSKYCNKEIQTDQSIPIISLKYQNQEIQTRNAECPIRMKKLRRSVKIIQMKLLRREKKISNLEDILGFLANTCEISNSEWDNLSEMFGDMLLEIQLSWDKIK